MCSSFKKKLSRTSIEELLARTELRLETSQSTIETTSSEKLSRAAELQASMFMEAVAGCTDFPSFVIRKYPCWVVSLTNLKELDELVEHEEIIGKLEELLPDSTSPSCAYSFFISQNWEGGKSGRGGKSGNLVRGRPHPDNMRNTKLRWLKMAKEHMQLPPKREIWFWFDFISIPQRSLDLQSEAVSSLPAYTQLCTRFVVNNSPYQNVGSLSI